MSNFICTTCGTQFAESQEPPSACLICQDERQYVKKAGQQWTTLERLRLTNRNSIKFEEPGLIGIGIDPPFAIGQRALFLQSPKANILWDCISLLDQAVVESIKALGGISAIAISHPHYYSNMSALLQVAALLRNGPGKQSKELLAVAVKAAEAAVQVVGNKDAQTLIELASTYFVAGDKAKAKEYARKAVEAAAGESAALKQDIEQQAKSFDDGKN